jgi:hypothetical protein
VAGVETGVGSSLGGGAGFWLLGAGDSVAAESPPNEPGVIQTTLSLFGLD